VSAKEDTLSELLAKARRTMPVEDQKKGVKFAEHGDDRGSDRGSDKGLSIGDVSP
jgi:hypothetical protein